MKEKKRIKKNQILEETGTNNLVRGTKAENANFGKPEGYSRRAAFKLMAAATASFTVPQWISAKEGGLAYSDSSLASSAPSAPETKEMKPLQPGSVKIGGEIGRRIELTVTNNLLKLEVEKDFLAPLKGKNGAYVGVGILLDSASLLAAATGNEGAKAIRDRIVLALLEAQDQDGYIGYKQPADRVWKMFDPDEASQIMLGLVSHYRCTGDTKSLSAAQRLAGFYMRSMRSDPARIKQGYADVMQWIALDYALLTLSAVSAEPAYRDFCIQERRLPEWTGPIVLGRWYPVEGTAYGHLAKCLAQLQLYRITRDVRLIKPTKKALDFMTRLNGMAITGAIGELECWHDTQDGTWNLGETCATTFLLLTLDNLIRFNRFGFNGDLMERIIYNTLFAAQSKDGRSIRYYTAFDGPRSYYPSDTYCCPNNFRRGIGLLQEVIYYRVDDGVAVNMYTASNADVTLTGNLAVKLRQETDYPRSGRITLYVEPTRTARFPVWLRIPAWCSKASVSLNGQPAGQKVIPGQFLVLNYEWKTGDRIDLNLPMEWRWVKGRQAQAGRVALMRGPLVFCLNPSRNEELAGVNLHQLWIIPETLEGPFDDDSVRPGGMTARVKGWKPGVWVNIGLAKPDVILELTEFPDAGGEATYFRVPNPQDTHFVDDELLASDDKK
jgi:DUF1680 family protein